MTARPTSALAIRWNRFAPTRDRLWLVFGGWAALSVLSAAGMYVAVFLGASGAMIGGDFSVFHLAGEEALAGRAAALYDPAAFQARLNAVWPGRDDLNLTWQYPPSYLLLVAPFAPLPYLLGFTLWALATGALMIRALDHRIDDRLILFGLVASPAAFAAFVTGQNGFLTAALLLTAAFEPKSRPLLAGLAAGLLTVKPHLGLLIPIAYLAAGCWRAAGVAALTGAALAALSLAAFGAGPWIEFAGAVAAVSGKVAAQLMPLAKMASPYSAALYAGLPNGAALVFHAGLSLIAVLCVWRVWRRSDDAMARAAVLLAATLLAAPYGFYYELIILGFPVAFVALRGLSRGWLKYERAGIALAWALPALTPMVAETRHGLSISFVVTLMVFAMVLRRVHASDETLFPWTAPRVLGSGALKITP